MSVRCTYHRPQAILEYVVRMAIAFLTVDVFTLEAFPLKLLGTWHSRTQSSLYARSPVARNVRRLDATRWPHAAVSQQSVGRALDCHHDRRRLYALGALGRYHHPRKPARLGGKRWQRPSSEYGATCRGAASQLDRGATRL